jgi:RNA 2',3'-cyclic 3'-phosphodiesterase
MNNSNRIFIAADASSKDTIEKLQYKVQMSAGWNSQLLKPVSKQSFHFTLIFLGEVIIESIDMIKTKISEIKFEPIKITYSGIGGFPNSNAARVIWIGVDAEGDRKLTDLAEKVRSKMKEIGFMPDKPFTPHMTLFRIKTGKLKITTKLLSEYDHISFGSDIINKVHLKRSDLTSSGPIYTDIFTVNASD